MFEEGIMRNVILFLFFFFSVSGDFYVYQACEAVPYSDPNNANCCLCKWNEIICFKALADECDTELLWFQISWIFYSITRLSGPSLKVGLHTFTLLNSKNCSDLYLMVQVIFSGYPYSSKIIFFWLK